MNTFLTSDEWRYRLGRTVVQGVIGVVIANLDLIVGACILDATWRPFVVAMVMAILSPIMAILGGTNFDGGNGEPGGAGVAGDVAAIGDAGGVVDGSGSGTSSLGK